MNNWQEEIYKLYLDNIDAINIVQIRKNDFYFYSKEIDEKFVTDNFVVCPICGYIKSNISLHVKNKHGLIAKSYYEKFDKNIFPMVAKNFAKKAAVNHIFTDEERNFHSQRMKNNNPMKQIKARKKVSNTRKNLYKNDIVFRDKMKIIYNENMKNMIKIDNFKVPGWGVCGYFKDIYFRSSYELKALVYFYKHNMFDNIEQNICITYNNEVFFCDFKINNIFYEIKDKVEPQDDRERKQYKIIDLMRKDGYIVNIWNKKSEELKSVLYIEILEHYLNNDIVFIEKSNKYSLVKKLNEEKEFYEKNKSINN